MAKKSLGIIFRRIRGRLVPIKKKSAIKGLTPIKRKVIKPTIIPKKKSEFGVFDRTLSKFINKMIDRGKVSRGIIPRDVTPKKGLLAKLLKKKKR